jgi:anti-anti-sigma factor
MMLNYTEENIWVIVHLESDLDMSNSNAFKENINNEFIANGKNYIALDFTKLEYIDSSGLGTVVSIHKRCKTSGGKLAIYGINETLARLFKLTSLDKALNIYETKENLLNSD